jgi:hypothetical protein
MTYKTVKKILARIGKLFGDVLVDVVKFTLCALILTSMFDNMDKGWVTYAKFALFAIICLVAGALLTHNGHNDHK